MIKYVTFFSETLHRETNYHVFLPDGTGAATPYRTLYLLHGYNESSSAWGEHTNILEYAQTNHLTLIMPTASNGYYQDRKEELMKTYIGEELLEETRRNFPLSARREDTFLGGMSMGGFGSLLIGSRYSQSFGKIACFSAAFVIDDVLIGNPGVLGNANASYFKRVLGDFDTLKGSDRDPVAEALRAFENGTLPPVLLACGTRDPLYTPNLKAYRELQRIGADITWLERDGVHSWSFVNQILIQALDWLIS